MKKIIARDRTENNLVETNNPLVTVIISNYNYANFLCQAIDSVFAQTYQNFELIIVDDGSSDRSREIIESYGERLIALFQNNSGQGAAFNTALSQAKGEIVCFLDADDYYHPEKLAKVVAAFQQHPQWVQISHGRTSIDRQGKVVGTGYQRHSQGDVSGLLLRWGKYAWSITSGLVYRRQTLMQVLPIPTKRKEAADAYLTAVVPFYGEVGSIEEPLMFYRMHGNNLQAYNDNLEFLLRQKEAIADYINQTAAQLGLRDRFDLQRDVDYRSLKAIQHDGVPLRESLSIIGLSLRESIAIKRSFKDIVERTLRRSICALFPNRGRAVLRLGLRGYLRSIIFKRQRVYTSN
ncbi:glycosyltransferase family 2 protein [Myxosarcina sp. GI1(2024)]